MGSNRDNDNSPFFAVLVASSFDLMFLMTPYWQLTVIAAILGGTFCTKMTWGAISGIIGISIAWSIYFLTNPIFFLVNQLGEILGLSDVGGLILMVALFFGTLLGFLGGSIGSALRILIIPSKQID